MVSDSQTGHIDQIKQINAGIVYRLVDTYGPVSRIDLSRHSQLAPASITKIVREMLEAHLVQETEIQEPGSRGRPAIGLMLETESWHYLSLHISCGEIALGLRELSGKLVVEDTVLLKSDDSITLLDHIIHQVEEFFIRHQHKLERLTAIAITLPGIIDTVRGIVHRMPFYNVHNVPLKKVLQNITGVPVFIQHDINAWTMAEAMFGASYGLNNVIQIVIDQHVGAGVITDGKLLHAAGRSLVEIGHIQVDPKGKRCYCGNVGCLETIVSIDNVLAQAQQRITQSLGACTETPLTVESLCNMALKGDELAKDVIECVGQHIGRILAIMVNIFNPQKILIDSPFNKAAEIFHPVISDCLRQQALSEYNHHLRVESTQYNSRGTFASAALIKNALYDGSLLIPLLQG